MHASFEAGILTSDAFAGRVTGELGLSLPLEEFARDWNDIFWLNEPVSRLIARLKSRGYTLILGSNTNCLHASFYRRRFASTLDHFDALVLSYEVGCLKPDRRFYDACAAAAGALAGECVFIDDVAENVLGARRAGLQSLQYVDMAGLVDGLRGLGVEVALLECSTQRLLREIQKSNVTIGSSQFQASRRVERPEDEPFMRVEIQAVQCSLDLRAQVAWRTRTLEAGTTYGSESWCIPAARIRRRFGPS